MAMNRRRFLGTASSAVLVAGTMATGKVFGANDRVRIGSAGLRGRGWTLGRTAHDLPDAELVALCDPDANVLAPRTQELKDASGKEPRAYNDIRDMVADPDIDAVTVGTPNHWHVLAAIWAMQNGKDVYVEKPISHTVFEGRQLVEAQKKHGRVVQHGTQRRSEPPWQRAAERIRSGLIGDIHMVRCNVTRFREPFSFPASQPVPDGLDWTLWQGPATEKPYSENYVHYNWHWFWHYGNAETGNNGPHRMDVANWYLDKGLPVRSYSTGGIFGYTDDARETPNFQSTTHTFADGTTLILDIRNRYTVSGPFIEGCGTKGHFNGTAFYDTDGNVIPDDQELPVVDKDTTKVHMAAFIKAVRAGDPAAVPATPLQGHIAAALCHLGNISYRVGRSIQFDPATEQVVGDEQANALLTRVYRPGFEVPKIT
ncbi:MAG: Gfo/Idh/MocA family oxidoreductase [bacterium]|nr:Gfo/Idh/MocA family oxidoreductase [bacterium]